MKPQRISANDHGIDWTAFWADHVKELDARELQAANDDEPLDRGMGHLGVGAVIVVALLVLVAVLGALQ